MPTNRAPDEASTTIALLAATALLATAGLALALTGDEQPPAASPAMQDEQTASPTSDEIEWYGHLAVDACAPTGPNSCSGATIGDAEDRYDTRIDQDVEQASLEMRWESDTPDTEELELRLATGHAERCGQRATCYYWTTHAKAVGTSPLTLDASDVSVEEGDTVWILVDAPELTPDPVHSDAHTVQHFDVTGEVVTTDGST